MFLSKNKKRLFFNCVKQSFLLQLFLFSFLAVAQNFSKVDATVLSYPFNMKRANTLASKIENDFSTDLDKVRAVYIYLTHNISYDLNEYKYGAEEYRFRYSSKEELAQKIRARDLKIVHKTLASKRAICDGYATTFKEICTLLNIKSEVISGFTRTTSSEIGELPLEERHAWNAVFVNATWNLVDATWGAGYSRDTNHWTQAYDEHYFFTKPAALITSHFPEVPKWQILTSPKTEKEFTEQPLFSSLFFSEGMQLISPTTGTLSSKKEFLIVKIKNAKPDIEFGFAFENDYYVTSTIPEFKNNIATLKIPLKGKRNTTLNILSETEMILKFQIE